MVPEVSLLPPFLGLLCGQQRYIAYRRGMFGICGMWDVAAVVFFVQVNAGQKSDGGNFCCFLVTLRCACFGSGLLGSWQPLHFHCRWGFIRLKWRPSTDGRLPSGMCTDLLKEFLEGCGYFVA